ncbi:acyl-CoA dehydrogenase [Stenotrophomonas sp. C3(2023)]|uniref:acyl-CoA dehydrogenase n=1 Tax=Stenotrophomonas sp. C3(2023) TaxID=3080277 RepID=UPI00293C8AD2|nr:acyl-CoA dehydrogenase [Stenotrophomonas sp. C3(2023)]MDV3468592.1 acyl-CoA dehydrogenase [Stenotrophomonas sp. C3(2023)]
MTPDRAPLVERARNWLQNEPALPFPGGGDTLGRWQALARMGAEDLALAKVLEAHHDAVAILHELGLPAPAALRDGSVPLLAVWAAEGPACTLRVDDRGRLDGDKPWCSGADLVDGALVTARGPHGTALYRVDAGQWTALPDQQWHAPGMTMIPSTTVRFARVAAAPVAGPDAYLDRPGFWHGGAGIAAVWYGATVALAERMRPACADGLRARLLGEVDLILPPAAALLRELAAAIDAAPDNSFQQDVIRVRSVVERAASRVLDLAGRALGPAPMCLEPDHAQRWADLAVFIRQSHGDKDWAWLGAARAGQEAPWTL